MSETDAKPLTLVLDARAQAALMRSQTASIAWRCADTRQDVGSLWDERMAAALHLAEVIDRLATLQRITDSMTKFTEPEVGAISDISSQ